MILSLRTSVLLEKIYIYKITFNLVQGTYNAKHYTHHCQERKKDIFILTVSATKDKHAKRPRLKLNIT